MAYILTGAFMLLDMLTGLVKAFYKKEYTSTVMRQGLFHKCGAVLCVMFAVLVDYTQAYLDLGVTLPVAVTVCTYIIVMEIGSIIENVCSINPDIMPDKLRALFAKLSDGNDN